MLPTPPKPRRWLVTHLMVLLTSTLSACADDPLPNARETLDTDDNEDLDAGTDSAPDTSTDTGGSDAIDSSGTDTDDGGSEDTSEDTSDLDAGSDPTDITEDAAQDTAGDTAEDTDTGPPPVVRFIAFGDWGTSASAVTEAADAMWEFCQDVGCDFVVGLGDNFYDVGVTSTDDVLWTTRWAEPFADWDIPFYMSLGNHDYLGNEQAQIDYTLIDDYWVMPDYYYDVDADPVHLFATDENIPYEAQARWLAGGLASNTAPWTIAFGHHPWRSNGVHGDSEGSRRVFQEFAMCHRVDMLLSGHDHDLQHLLPECGVDLIVSGNVVTRRDVETSDNTIYATSDYGFVWFEVTPDLIHLEFHAMDGELLHESDRERSPPEIDCTDDGYCEALCDDGDDTDCDGLDCGDDGECNDLCTSDWDCYDNCPCDYNFGLCEPIAEDTAVRCGCDPQCRGTGRPCQADDHCDTWCPVGDDPDCL